MGRSTRYLEVPPKSVMGSLREVWVEGDGLALGDLDGQDLLSARAIDSKRERVLAGGELVAEERRLAESRAPSMT